MEINPFRCFIPANADKLIIGSFPCFNGNDYGNWYYSGSGKNHFWKLLSDIFEMPAGSKAEKVALCQKNKIALTDIAYQIVRTKNNCSDANLKISEFNMEGVSECLQAGVQRIFFTSRFVEKHFRRLFPDCGIPGVLLLSPSPAANMHIGSLNEYRELKLREKINSPYEYRLLKYRKEFEIK